MLFARLMKSWLLENVTQFQIELHPIIHQCLENI